MVFKYLSQAANGPIINGDDWSPDLIRQGVIRLALYISEPGKKYKGS
jgi:hypothetical protein